MENQITKPTNSNEMSNSKIVKFIIVALLTVFMLLPLFMVQSLIVERNERQKEVKKEITNKWGKEIKITGPIVMVPYKDVQSKKLYNAYFYPNRLQANVDAKMKDEPLKVGIYKSNVFHAKMKFNGSFGSFNFAKENIPNENIFWNQAKIIVEVNSLKGLKSEVQMLVQNQKVSLEPNMDSNTEGQFESPILDARSLLNSKYNFNIDFNASDSISITPIGKITDVTMKSNWHSPGFMGDFAPQNRKISPNGFDANWHIIASNMPFKQEHFKWQPDFSNYQITTTFVTPVDQYQLNERVSKYGFLVIGLTFLVFFIIQLINKIDINIFHYSMIGLALVMFYTLLISITEHSSFNFAYLIASTAVIAMIGLFSSSILKSKKFALFISSALTVIYTFIFTIIQLEDYALLAGSIGLFAILGAVMYVSQKINWKE